MNEVDFRIPSGSFNTIHDLSIKVTITETGGTNTVTLLSTPLWLDHFEVWVGPKTIQTVYPEVLYTTLGLLTSEQLINVAPIFNINPSTYASGTALAAGATKSYIIPLTGICCALT